MNSKINRRKFIGMAASSSATLLLSPSFAFAGTHVSDRKIRVGVVGGRFGLEFFFNEHPNCVVEAVSDLLDDRRTALMKTYQCEKSFESLEKMVLDPKIEAIAIFTGAPDHARHVIMALNHGKHVLCAVPVAMTLDDCHMILETVKRTGLTYMMAETTTYRQPVITVKKLFKEGAFGRIFSSASQYYHPGGDYIPTPQDKTNWRYGLPPMLYPTHVTAHLVAVTGERLTTVSCLGWGDAESPMLKGNMYSTPFWNQTAFFKTNEGNAFIGEVCWKGALVGTERGEWRGEKMSFYAGYKGLDTHKVLAIGSKSGLDDGGFAVSVPTVEKYEQEKWWKTMLPAPINHQSHHGDSHCFITHEFISSIIENRQPEVNIYEALAYTVPGIIANESSLRNGEMMSIPTLT